jgi:hypothetical protein
VDNFLSEAEKATFKAATERRRAHGIHLRKFSLMCDEKQVEGLSALFDAFITRWGKQKGIDHIISILSRVEARMQDAESEDESGQAQDS